MLLVGLECVVCEGPQLMRGFARMRLFGRPGRPSFHSDRIWTVVCLGFSSESLEALTLKTLQLHSAPCAASAWVRCPSCCFKTRGDREMRTSFCVTVGMKSQVFLLGNASGRILRDQNAAPITVFVLRLQSHPVIPVTQSAT